MGLFTDYIETLNEKTALMKLYDKGVIDLQSFEMKKLNGKEQLHVDDVLSYFGYVGPIATINKMISKMKYTTEIGSLYSLPSDADGAKKDYEKAIEWLEGTEEWSRGTPSFIDIDKAQYAKEYYNTKSGRKELQKAFFSISKIKANHKQSFINQIEAETGIKMSSLVTGFEWIHRYRTMSGRIIDKSVYPFLHALTVNKGKKLPKKVYRGLFMDGEKFLKMKPNVQDTYKVGNEIKLNNSKATSWSTSKGVAVQFMEAQDKVKNREDGFGLLVSYEIQSEEDVIADFRVLPDMRFFNQQEILISPTVKFGKIEAIIKHGEEVDLDTVRKFGDDAYGIELTDYINNIISINEFNLPQNEIIQLKGLINLTLKEVVKMYPNLLQRWPNPDQILKEKGDLILPLAVSIGQPDKVLSPTKVEQTVTSRYVTEFDLNHTFDDKKGNKEMADYIDEYTITQTIELKSYSAKSFKFEFVVSKIDFKWRGDVPEDKQKWTEELFKKKFKESKANTQLRRLAEDSHKFHQKNVNFNIKIEKDV